MLRTTVGNLLVNSVLPDDLKSPEHVLDKKGVTELFRQIAEKHPTRYRELAQKLMKLGSYGAQAAGATVKLSDTVPSPEVEKELSGLRQLIQQVNESDEADDIKESKIVKMIVDKSDALDNAIYDAGLKFNNNLAMQVKSGSRGNKVQLRQIVAGDFLVSDHKDRVIPIPILHGYSHGLDPVEYFAASFGARKGTIDVKLATQRAGFFAKQLAMAVHRLVVTEDDCGTNNGIPVVAGESANVGTLLAKSVHGLGAGHILTPQDVKGLRDNKIVVRSPVTCQAPHGICAKCAGVRETGRLPDIGDNIGLPAGQSISEKLSQSQLSSKHGGGAIGASGSKGVQGFDLINSLVQVPESFHGSATVSKADGRVTRIDDAPQGGKYVWIDQDRHYISPEQAVTVQTHDLVESGDAISDGIPNPADLVHHKGIGAGRMAFINIMGKALADSRMPANRRNLELISRGLINHVRVTDLDGVADSLPDDIVTYDNLSRGYQPREGSVKLSTKRSAGKYLEQPTLHYSIGTRITPKVAADLSDNGIDEVLINDQSPQFEPVMVRAMEQGLRDPNPMTRLGGSYLEKGTLTAVHRGQSIPDKDTSFIPALAKGTGFGDTLKTDGTY